MGRKGLLLPGWGLILLVAAALEAAATHSKEDPS